MTTTLDIPDDVLQRAMLAAGTNSSQDAVLQALEEFVSRHDQRKLIPLLGTFSDDFLTPEELDQNRRAE